jgi:type IV secretory pathway TraG/TraD family ATPase VirD4
LGFSKESGKEIRFNQDSHLTVIGPTGASKTSSYLLPNVLGLDRYSQFLIDIKGAELTHVAGEHRASLGPYYIIAPYGIDGPVPKGARICRYNPMAPLFDGSVPKNRIEATARRNSDGCVGGAVIGKDSFFTNGGRRTFTICQLALAKHGAADEKNLPAVARWIEGDFRGLCRRIAMEDDPEFSPIFLSYLRELKRDKAGFGDIIQTIVVETAFLRDPAIAEALSGSDFRFAWLGREVSTAALCMPLDLVEVNGKTSRLLCGAAFGELLRPDRPRKHKIVIWADETYQYGTMDPLVNAYATARAFGVQVCTVWSELGMMRERYPHAYTSILANSGALVMFGARDPETAKFMSDQSGAREVVTHSRSVNCGRDGWPIVSDSKSQSRREVLMTREAMNLPTNEALLWIRGVPGIIRTAHKRYFEQWRFFFRYRKNPLYRKH